MATVRVKAVKTDTEVGPAVALLARSLCEYLGIDPSLAESAGLDDVATVEDPFIQCLLDQLKRYTKVVTALKRLQDNPPKLTQLAVAMLSYVGLQQVQFEIRLDASYDDFKNRSEELAQYLRRFTQTDTRINKIKSGSVLIRVETTGFGLLNLAAHLYGPADILARPFSKLSSPVLLEARVDFEKGPDALNNLLNDNPDKMIAQLQRLVSSTVEHPRVDEDVEYQVRHPQEATFTTVCEILHLMPQLLHKRWRLYYSTTREHAAQFVFDTLSDYFTRFPGFSSSSLVTFGFHPLVVLRLSLHLKLALQLRHRVAVPLLDYWLRECLSIDSRSGPFYFLELNSHPLRQADGDLWEIHPERPFSDPNTLMADASALADLPPVPLGCERLFHGCSYFKAVLLVDWYRSLRTLDEDADVEDTDYFGFTMETDEGLLLVRSATDAAYGAVCCPLVETEFQRTAVLVFDFDQGDWRREFVRPAAAGDDSYFYLHYTKGRAVFGRFLKHIVIFSH